jgi:hypothetical protein
MLKFIVGIGYELDFNSPTHFNYLVKHVMEFIIIIIINMHYYYYHHHFLFKL